MTSDVPTPATIEPVAHGETPLAFTTRRGLATASFSLGLWGSLTFWWFPFGMWVGLIALGIGTVAQLMGWRANSNRDSLATVGQVLGAMAATTAYTCCRVMQYFFENYTPTWP
ncbi:hypothetical protein [Limnoglobus roseus]|uniref:DUF4190 domain-containing protein n=1 Tax=Limnoglobus roseus TaxID=2598579 RepID=A0A5C1A831_9BACT|nr:hypothetical protein [Limnoglobus roseus]QEL15361.1 hypothetical protein PX52LOC_02276 [Limnoglobus roseus]